ncbi:MAG: hypothetical protein FD180_222 [Planctomycetota bacterium]|nr:MAG: hypothetical protein FD180_222 [Planctomycetota bacterium]
MILALAASACGGPERRQAPVPEPGHSRLTSLGEISEDPCPIAGGVLFARRAPGQAVHIWFLPDSGPAPREWLVGERDVRAAAASRDGQRLAWTGNSRGTWDIFASSVHPGSNPALRPIAGSDDDETSPTWAPDGKRLAWAALDRRAAYWRLRVGDGSGEARDLGEGFAPAWHPTEDRIVCQRARPGGGLWNAVVVDVATGRATELWPQPGRGAITPSWSLDGNWILFAARLESPDEESAEFDGLWAVSPDGVKRIRLSAAGVDTFSPRETTDGRIVYCRREGNAVELWSFKSPLARAEHPK